MSFVIVLAAGRLYHGPVPSLPTDAMFRNFFLLLCCFGLHPLAAAGHLAVPPVTVSELDDLNQYYIQGSFEAQAEPSDVFAVLSDYGHLAGVLSGLNSSRILERDGEHLKVEQVLQGNFLFFSKAIQLRLQITEAPPWRIDFVQAGNKPFRHYVGSWMLEKTETGTRVDYTLSVSRGDMAPIFIERKLFHENSTALMVELKAEVQRRVNDALQAKSWTTH